MRDKLVDTVDWFRRKVLGQHQWRVTDAQGKSKRVRVDCLPIDQFRYQRQSAAARLQTMQP